MRFYTLKTGQKYAKIMKWPKNHFQCTKMRFWGDFSWFRGVIRFIKVISDFCFGDRKCHFWYPQNCKFVPFFRILRYYKWHFRSPKRKSETTFIDLITPLNLGKITFWPLKIGTLAILHIFALSSKVNGTFLRYYRCKTYQKRKVVGDTLCVFDTH